MGWPGDSTATVGFEESDRVRAEVLGVIGSRVAVILIEEIHELQFVCPREYQNPALARHILIMITNQERAVALAPSRYRLN